ncbi:glycosyltransferase family 1 protein [Chaetomium strumarium]|uniref:Glycosyltransferase family 1 protein n=1 Tax=Chaetomium strumarium TaxID=1170767 RepID=A0AAJ0H362_9PEZI|nr:glycosyltransferase family 1 protein [Chaetomium strumarium]
MTEGTIPRRVTGTTRRGRTNAVPIAEELEETNLDVPPPAYGEHHDQLQFSQAGFAADAAVTADGRVNIHINEKNHRLSELLGPAIRRQLRAEAQVPSEPLPPAYIPPSLGGLPGQTTPPRLNVVIQIVGSRGDVQPFVALGQVLRDTYGHRVRLATHAKFRSFVEENGLEFFNIGGDPEQLMAFMVKNPGLMPKMDTLMKGDIKRRRQEIQEILMGCWRSCIEAGDGMGVAPPQHERNEPVDERFILPGDPGNRPFVADAIIANPPSFAHIHIAEKLGIPLHIMFTMPWTPTRAFPHPLADIVSTNTDAAITNYASYALVEMMTWQGLGDLINRFRVNTLELDPVALMWAPGLLNRLRVPVTYCWSPALTPKPADWMPEITVSGFYFLNLESSYTPEPDLAAFLALGPPPVYIGFGSIVVDDPDALTQTIFDAILRAGVRAIVSKGWGGIGGEAVGVPEGVFMLGNCPHDWLFNHVSAVVHHGGAGTTAAGIKAGKPTVVVPFFGDQLFWGSMVTRAGAGPAPIPFKKLTAEGLAAAIETALLPETQARARELGEKIKGEKGVDVGGKSFHQFLNTDDMRCSLAPSRVAVWRVRRSKVRLSTLAAAVLVKQGWLKYSDLKLYRSIEYNTDEQPWDPVSAVVLAFVGDVGSLTMAVADFPREVFKAHGKKDSVAKAGDAAPVTPGLAPSTSSSSHQPAGSQSDLASISSRALTPGQGSVESLSMQPSTSASTPNSTLSPQTTTASVANPPPPPRASPSPEGPSTPTNPMNLDMAVAAGKGVGRIVGAGLRFQANFCLGLARGFRNAPKLYNDDTVRPPEKVTDLVSGMKVAGKEFGLGLYDGISGLVTQPWQGAQKEGAMGFVKGFGKGIGGSMLKTASAVCALPAYTMQGIRVEMRNRFARSSMNYIITSRVLQGDEDLSAASAEERQDILARWHTKREELKGFYLLKQKESEKVKEEATAANASRADEGQGAGGGSDTKTGSRLNLPRGPWNRRRTGSSTTLVSSPGTGPPALPPTTANSAADSPSLEDDEALELAIRESVRQTSTGDREEDARVEAAIRASLIEMRRAAEQEQQQQPQQQFPGPTPGQRGWIADQKVAPVDDGAAVARDMADDEWTNITDEEYQALIEEAVRQSLLQQQMEQRYHYHYHGHDHWTADDERHHNPHPSVPELPGDFPTPDAAMTTTTTTTTTNASTTPHNDDDHYHHHRNNNNEVGNEDDDDEQLRRALEESARVHRSYTEEMQRQRTEEEIVLEYVKRQSLAEEAFRRAKAAGKGKAPPVDGDDDDDEEEEDEDEDEDLRRALDESLRVASGGGGGNAGPSGSGMRMGGTVG